MNTSNIKDILSTIAAWLIAIGSVLAGLNIVALHLPEWVTIIGGAMFALGAAMTSALTGKNPNGTTKTPTQIQEINSTAATTKPEK